MEFAPKVAESGEKGRFWGGNHREGMKRKNGLKTGKSGKNGDFGAKKVGWGSGEKMGFTADFAML